MIRKGLPLLLVLAAALTAGCAARPEAKPEAAPQAPPVLIGSLDNPEAMFGRPVKKSRLSVKAFSYVRKKTKAKHKTKLAAHPPPTGAWGDPLHPEQNSIAISPDLLDHGLTRNTKVKIVGLDGEYLVRDTMSKRWTKSIDIYLGDDIGAARAWGVRDVQIIWLPPAPEDSATQSSPPNRPDPAPPASQPSQGSSASMEPAPSQGGAAPLEPPPGQGGSAPLEPPPGG